MSKDHIQVYSLELLLHCYELIIHIKYELAHIKQGIDL